MKIVNRQSSIVVLFIALILNGCEFLDYSELSFAEKENVFSDYSRTVAFHTALPLQQ